MPRDPRRALAVTLAAAAALSAASCGGEEAAFDPDSFVAAANARGAGLTLGTELPTTREGLEFRRLDFTAGGSSAVGAEFAGGTGTLVVTPSDDDAFAEYERCEESVDLLCFRAANVALYFADASPAELDRLTTAITALGEG